MHVCTGMCVGCVLTHVHSRMCACKTHYEPASLYRIEPPTCASMLQHCCSRETGGFPRLVASCTRSSCSRWLVLPSTACSIATAANQLDIESPLNRPPHNSWPAEMVLAVKPDMVHGMKITECLSLSPVCVRLWRNIPSAFRSFGAGVERDLCLKILLPLWSSLRQYFNASPC